MGVELPPPAFLEMTDEVDSRPGLRARYTSSSRTPDRYLLLVARVGGVAREDRLEGVAAPDASAFKSEPIEGATERPTALSR